MSIGLRNIERLVDKRWRIGNREIHVEQRSRRSPMGRFGGGWQWKVGVQWTTSRCIIVSLFVLSIRITKVVPRAS